MPLALESYSVVMAFHIMAVFLAYGLPAAYPLLIPYVRRRHPEAMPGVHDVQHRLNRVLTGPGGPTGLTALSAAVLAAVLAGLIAATVAGSARIARACGSDTWVS